MLVESDRGNALLDPIGIFDGDLEGRAAPAPPDVKFFPRSRNAGIDNEAIEFEADTEDPGVRAVLVRATVDRGLEASELRYERTLQLLREMKTQGARMIALANSGDGEVGKVASDCVWIAPAPEYLLPISEVVPLQLFAYFMALEHGVNVDRPRNLSKAVVEVERALAS